MKADEHSGVSREKWLLLLALGVLTVLLPLALWEPLRPPLQLVEWKLQNFIHDRATPVPMRGDIVVLGIDDATLTTSSAFPEDLQASPTLQAMQKGWPFSRRVYADAITRLMDAGAKAVVLDLIFSGPVDPEGDQALRQALEKYQGKVILGANFAEVQNLNGATPMLQTPWEGLVPALEPWPANIGFINYWPDLDGVVRSARFNRSMRNEDAGRSELAHLDQIPSLTNVTLRSAGLGQVVPGDDEKHWLRFSSAGAYPPYSFHEIFVPDLWRNNFHNGQHFKDKIVLIGAAAEHMQDFHVTPVGRLLGVQLHAQILGSLLEGQFLAHPSHEFLGGSLLLAVLAAWALVTFWRRPISTMILLLLLTAGGVGLCYATFELANVVVDGVAPLSAFLLTGLLCLSYDFMLERKQRPQLRSYLQRYFSPDVVSVMLRDPQHFKSLQSGACRTITVMFSDLRGFTSLSEQLTPTELVKQLNQYFNRMVGVIHGQVGGIDKFIGDAIMAVWGWVHSSPTKESVQQDALSAVASALLMRKELAELNREWTARGLTELKIGVGLHQGDAVVGDLGSDKQSGFTVIGDSVNTASRLEGTTKEYGVDNIISDVVWNQVKHRFLCRSVDLTRVKGKTIPVPLFTVLDELEHGSRAGLEPFERGISLYRAGKFTDAREAFEQAANAGLNDYLTQLYLERCQALIEHPPATWDGVFVMTKK